MSQTSQNELLDDETLLAEVAQLDGWEVESGRLRRRFEFDGFPGAMAFMVRVAFAAEAMNHHPNWSNVYNRVEVELWSHDLGGVSRSCVALARAMNDAAG